MKGKSYELTANEELLMNIFWEQGRPLTSVDLGEYLTEECKEWKNGYLHNLLKTLLMDKKMLRVTDIIQYGRRYAKQYEPVFTKEEYAAKVVSKLNVPKSSVPQIAYALVKEVAGEDKEEIISELENILNRLKEECEEGEALI